MNGIVEKQWSAQKGIEIKRREDEEVAYSPFWIGSIYRYMFYSLRRRSTELKKIMPFDSLAESMCEFSVCDTEETVRILAKRFGGTEDSRKFFGEA